jgi:hypothetical protein
MFSNKMCIGIAKLGCVKKLVNPFHDTVDISDSERLAIPSGGLFLIFMTGHLYKTRKIKLPV